MRPILVLDAYLDERGGAHNLERLLRGRPLEVVRTLHGPTPRDTADFAGVVMTGSAASVLDEPRWLAPARALLADGLRRGVPVLGLCFGHQVLAQAAFGLGAVARAAEGELGWVEIERMGGDELLDVLPRRFTCFASHHDEVVLGAGPGLRRLARSQRCAVHAFRVEGARAWGVQFHAEMQRAESDELVRSALPRHPDLGTDPAALLAAAREERDLGAALLDRFASLAFEGGGLEGTRAWPSARAAR